MDRNCVVFSSGAKADVALRKESVDRNSGFYWWVEGDNFVALRKESVDRNPPMCTIRQMLLVALRKESVDRNWVLASGSLVVARRSPQGERG